MICFSLIIKLKKNSISNNYVYVSSSDGFISHPLFKINLTREKFSLYLSFNQLNCGVTSYLLPPILPPLVAPSGRGAAVVTHHVRSGSQLWLVSAPGHNSFKHIYEKKNENRRDGTKIIYQNKFLQDMQKDINILSWIFFLTNHSYTRESKVSSD